MGVVSGGKMVNKKNMKKIIEQNIVEPEKLTPQEKLKLEEEYKESVKAREKLPEDELRDKAKITGLLEKIKMEKLAEEKRLKQEKQKVEEERNKYYEEDVGLKGIREVNEHRAEEKEKIERYKKGEYTEEDYLQDPKTAKQRIDTLTYENEKLKKLVERINQLQEEIEKSNEVKRRLAILIYGEDSPVIKTCEQLSLLELWEEFEKKKQREKQKEIEEPQEEITQDIEELAYKRMENCPTQLEIYELFQQNPTMTSSEISENYEQIYKKPISPSNISHSLALMVEKGILKKQGNIFTLPKQIQ